MRRTIRRVARGAGAAVDRAAMSAIRRQTSGRAPARVPEDARRTLLDLTQHYRDANLFAWPESADVTLSERPGRHGGRVFDISYPSVFTPTLASYTDEHVSYQANMKARARLFTGDARAPCVVLIHGWRSGSYVVEERMFPVRMLRSLGLSVVLFQLPFHGHRAPAQAPRSGDLFPSYKVARTNETVGQLISDLRQLAQWLRSGGAAGVGVMGMSLGGYASALWASLDTDLDFAVPTIPAVNMAALMWNHGHGSRARQLALSRGVTLPALEAAFASHCPLEHRAKLPEERLMIIAGQGDRVAPPEQATALWEHWGKPPIHWFPGGHLAQFGRRAAFRALAQWLTGLGLTTSGKDTSLGGRRREQGPR